MVVSMKMTVFWDIVPGSLIEVNQHFRAGLLLMEAVSTSEMSANFYETMWHNITEDRHLQEPLHLKEVCS
jgi:hypothetical protein